MQHVSANSGSEDFSKYSSNFGYTTYLTPCGLVNYFGIVWIYILSS
jgi:hypothetical protein